MNLVSVVISRQLCGLRFLTNQSRNLSLCRNSPPRSISRLHPNLIYLNFNIHCVNFDTQTWSTTLLRWFNRINEGWHFYSCLRNCDCEEFRVSLEYYTLYYWMVTSGQKVEKIWSDFYLLMECKISSGKPKLTSQ